MEQRLDTTWRKSTYSGGSGTDCVEIAGAADYVLVRDTKDRDGATLSVPATAWRTFTARLKLAATERKGGPYDAIALVMGSVSLFVLLPGHGTFGRFTFRRCLGTAPSQRP